MKIRSAAVLGAGAVGAYFVYGLMGKKDLDFCVVADGDRKLRLERDGITVDKSRRIIEQMVEQHENDRNPFGGESDAFAEIVIRIHVKKFSSYN